MCTIIRKYVVQLDMTDLGVVEVLLDVRSLGNLSIFDFHLCNYF